MTPASLLASARALIEGNPDAAGLIDRCDVIKVSTTIGSAGGSPKSEVVVASDVPCLYEERTYKPSRVIAGQPKSSATHNLFLVADSVTRVIGAGYRIVVAARDDTPELTFTGPVRLDETLGPLVALGATLEV